MSSLLLAWRAFISEATSGETLFCNFAQRCLLPVPVSIPTSDEPESFFIGETPSSEDGPFGWGVDFDEDHQVMSDQDLPLSPVRRMESAQMDPCLSSRHTMKDAELAKCEPGMPDALCNAAEQAKNFQGYVVADDMAAADSRDSLGTVDYTHKDLAPALTLVGNFMQPPGARRYRRR